MKKKQMTIGILDDLIRVNNDRIMGYEKAAHEQNNMEPEVRSLFYRWGLDSRSFVNELHAEVLQMGGAPVTKSTIMGKIYLCWLTNKHAFEGSDPPSLLEACAVGEEAVQQSYRQALDPSTGLALEEDRARLILERQLAILTRSSETLKELKIHA
jgi:uncharacterized protein (TIGR02284 family)